MTAFLGWLDHDPDERERMNRVLSLFQESESRDELGLGPIREAISDHLFPGTSVLQTRLRYFLFVPWIYRRLEDGRVPSLEVAKKARTLEIGLIEPLLATGYAAGVLGKRARGALKLLPSAAYWNGLESWGIRLYPRSIDDYHRAFDRLGRATRRRRDDGDVESDHVATWDPNLPSAPASFPDEASFALTTEEARYVRDRIMMSHPSSLLAFLAGSSPSHEVDAPWQHGQLPKFRPEHRELLHHARLFSTVTHGAALVYNVALARLAVKRELLAQHENALERWVSELHGLPIDDWSLDHFWKLAHHPRHSVREPVQSFVARWLTIATKRSIDAVSSRDAHQLVEMRERMLKGTRSRYANPRVRDRWSGWSALDPATYRWRTAQRLLADLHRGLGEG